jgi:hypothetical protein
VKPCLYTFGNGSVCGKVEEDHNSLTNHAYSEVHVDYVEKIYD